MEQSDVLRYVLEVLEAQGLQYMLVGSLASGVFGEGRTLPWPECKED
ncbi:MAG TPA: hypothetical protein VHY91_16220 [Pirellulales bacterium]|nr:hypothetical protein [Pirellulales bacterium]